MPLRRRPFSRRRAEFEVTTDPARLDLKAVHAALKRSYWARDIPRATLARAIDGSRCYSLLREGRTIGFARVVSDGATFAWLCDVYVLEQERGKGLGKWLIACVRADPALKGLRNFLLRTRDAHGLYAAQGWKPPANPASYMEISHPDMYAKARRRALRAKRNASRPERGPIAARDRRA